MIHESVAECIGKTPLVALRRLFPGHNIIAKLEFLNPGGSIKDRPARMMIESGLRSGLITSDSCLVESSSGNMGIALAMIARCYKLRFICVVDPKIAPMNLQILEQLGAQIEMVTTLDEQGGYLQTRVRRVQELVATLPGAIWVNQYSNLLNPQAHFDGTGDEILADLDGPADYFVAAVSTTGTILGTSRRLRQDLPQLKVVAVDLVGSVLFGRPAGPRHVPGIGASREPELLADAQGEIDEVISVTDHEAVLGCFQLLRHEGIFAGGSSGAVIAALYRLLPTLPANSRVVTILPDRGERYLSTIYSSQWRAETLQMHDTNDVAHEQTFSLPNGV